MQKFHSDDLQAGLDGARVRAGRLALRHGGRVVPILRCDDDGLWVETSRAGTIPGYVDIFDGPSCLARALIVAVESDAGVTRFAFKQRTQATDAPAADFIRKSATLSLPAPDAT